METKTIYENLTANIEDLKSDSKYNRRRIFIRARYIYKNSVCSWSEALTQAWDDAKQSMVKTREQLKVAINKLAKAYNVAMSPAYYQAEMERQMLRAYNMDTKMN